MIVPPKARSSIPVLLGLDLAYLCCEQCNNEKQYKRCNNFVSYEFRWLRRICDYIKFNADYCVLCSSRNRVRIRFNVWMASGYAHVFVLVSEVNFTLTC